MRQSGYFWCQKVFIAKMFVRHKAIKVSIIELFIPISFQTTWNAKANKYISPATVSSWVVVFHAEHSDLVK
jgi:hypothetical protein